MGNSVKLGHKVWHFSIYQMGIKWVIPYQFTQKKIQFYTWPSQNLFKFGTHKIWNVPSITKEKLAKSAHRFSRYDPPFFCCFNKKGRSHQFSNGHYARTSWPLLMKLVSLERKLRKESNKCIKKCARAI